MKASPGEKASEAARLRPCPPLPEFVERPDAEEGEALTNMPDPEADAPSSERGGRGGRPPPGPATAAAIRRLWVWAGVEGWDRRHAAAMDLPTRSMRSPKASTSALENTASRSGAKETMNLLLSSSERFNYWKQRVRITFIKTSVLS